MSAYW